MRRIASIFILAYGCVLSCDIIAQDSSPAQKRQQFRKEIAASREAPLSPEQVAIAERVYTGRIACELGQNVAVLRDPVSPGYFIITTGSQRYHLMPVPTTTGAIRLEDKVRGGIWLQLVNKSMLLDEKNGRRLADECMSPEQKQVAEAMKIAPPPRLIDTPLGAVPNAEPLPAAATSTPAPVLEAAQPADSSRVAPVAPRPLNLNLPR